MQIASSASSRYGASASALRVDGDGLDAELAAGADDAQGDLAAVGDRMRLNMRPAAAQSTFTRKSGWPNSTGLAVLDQDLDDLARAARP